ncbi:MAG: transposase [Megasphaera micronuciformis]|nr:transposase [Megasphaera micronuciformis]
MTTITEIFRLLHEGLNYTTIARSCYVSVTTVIRYCFLISISRPKELPSALVIDEFRGNVAEQKYQVILIDPDSHNVIDVLPKKDTNALCRYFASYSRKARQKVRFIVMDMSPQLDPCVGKYVSISSR